MPKIKDVIRIKETMPNNFFTGYGEGAMEAHNSLLNKKIVVDDNEIMKALKICTDTNKYHIGTMTRHSILEVYTKEIKTAILSGKVIREKKCI